MSVSGKLLESFRVLQLWLKQRFIGNVAGTRILKTISTTQYYAGLVMEELQGGETPTRLKLRKVAARGMFQAKANLFKHH